MEKEKDTTISIKPSTWVELNKRRNVGESMDNLVKRLLLEFPEIKDEQEKR